MWTLENRARYDRSKLRYPSDLRALCGRPGGCNAYLPPLTPATPLPGDGGDNITTGDRHCYAHPMCILPSGALGLERDLSRHRPRSASARVTVRRHSGGAREDVRRNAQPLSVGCGPGRCFAGPLSGVRSLGVRPCVKRQLASVGGPVSRALTWGISCQAAMISSSGNLRQCPNGVQV